MLKKINPKVKRVLSVTGHIVGTISFLFIVYAVFTTWIAPSDPVVAPNQVVRQMDSDPGHLPEHVVIKSTVSEIKKVPLYGYSYKVSEHMYIVNFSRWNLKIGDQIRFRITGAIRVGDTYLVNADYE